MGTTARAMIDDLDRVGCRAPLLVSAARSQQDQGTHHRHGDHDREADREHRREEVGPLRRGWRGHKRRRAARHGEGRRA